MRFASYLLCHSSRFYYLWMADIPKIVTEMANSNQNARYYDGKTASTTLSSPYILMNADSCRLPVANILSKHVCIPCGLRIWKNRYILIILTKSAYSECYAFSEFIILPENLVIVIGSDRIFQHKIGHNGFFFFINNLGVSVFSVECNANETYVLSHVHEMLNLNIVTNYAWILNSMNDWPTNHWKPAKHAVLIISANYTNIC